MPGYERIEIISHEIGERGSLSLRIVGGNVVVRATDGNEACLRATMRVNAASQDEADGLFDASALVVERGTGRLSVSGPEAHGITWDGFMRLFGGRRVSFDFEVTMPRAASLRIEDVSARVRVEGVVGDQRHRTASGDRELVGVAGRVWSEGVSGDLTVRAVERLELHSTTLSGDLRVVAPTLALLSASSVSGDVDVEGGFDSGVNHGVRTLSGDLRVAARGGVSIAVNGFSTSIGGSAPHRVEGGPGIRVVVIGDGAGRVTFSSMSGSVVVRQAVAGAEPETSHEAPAASAPGAGESAASVGPGASEPAGPDGPMDDLEILRALEQGRIDVDQAARLLSLAGARDA